VSLLSRMVEWFAAQPQLIQGGVLGHLPREMQEQIPRLILTRMSEAPGKKAADKPRPQ
jgi:hypothetical protein